MKRVVTIAHQMGNDLCESWAIVLDTLDMINIAVTDPNTTLLDNDGRIF